MPDVEITVTSTEMPSKVGRYTVKLGAPILDAPIWYVEQPNPLGEPAEPLVRAMCITRSLACRVAAGLACFDACQALLAWFDEPGIADGSQALGSFLGPIRAALAFGKRH